MDHFCNVVMSVTASIKRLIEDKNSSTSVDNWHLHIHTRTHTYTPAHTYTYKNIHTNKRDTHKHKRILPPPFYWSLKLSSVKQLWLTPLTTLLQLNSHHYSPNSVNKTKSYTCSPKSSMRWFIHLWGKLCMFLFQRLVVLPLTKQQHHYALHWTKKDIIWAVSSHLFSMLCTRYHPFYHSLIQNIHKLTNYQYIHL